MSEEYFMNELIFLRTPFPKRTVFSLQIICSHKNINTSLEAKGFKCLKIVLLLEEIENRCLYLHGMKRKEDTAEELCHL